jgi:hypothetical protein
MNEFHPMPSGDQIENGKDTEAVLKIMIPKGFKA